MIVYIISNLINDKVYIGQHQGTELVRRWKQHIKAAQAGSGLVFHRAIRKYGIDSFSVAQLSTVSSKIDLDEQEIFFIQKYQSANPLYGYNMTHGGQTGGMHGKHQTEFQKQRAKEVQTGRLVSSDTRKKMSLAAQNRVCPESLRQKRREFTKGNTNAEGMQHTKTFIAQLSKRVKNSRWINDGKNDKLVEVGGLAFYLANGWQLGRVFHSRAPHSIETKQKLKDVWAQRKRKINEN